MNFTMSPYENSAGNMKLTLTTSRESLFDSYYFYAIYACIVLQVDLLASFYQSRLLYS